MVRTVGFQPTNRGSIPRTHTSNKKLSVLKIYLTFFTICAIIDKNGGRKMKLTKELLIDLCHKYKYVSAKNLKGITIDMICEAVVRGESIVPYVRCNTGCAKQTVTDFLAKTFIDRNPIKDRDIIKFLLFKEGLKYCRQCDEVLEFSYFNKNKSTKDGYGDHCRICANDARIASYNKDPAKEIRANAERKRDIKERTPVWSQKEEILDFYRKRPEGYHVDHILPLHGKEVSGLHVIENLQYLPALENLAKGNR